MDKSTQFILWFDQMGIEDVPFTGGKNASLGEMYRLLVPQGVKVPNGFAVTAYAYRYLLEKTGIKDEIANILSDLNTSDMENLAERGRKVRALIRSAEFPQELRDAIVAAYDDLCGAYHKQKKDVDVAVRSSATAEDLPDASFAGQQETFLNIKGEEQLIDACRKCFASLFTNRAISYREDKGFDHFSIALSIGVQKMVRSDLACSGVMFSIDTESGFEKAALITAAYGLGENVVQGAVNPDEYYVFKPTLREGFRPIISKKVGLKDIKMIYDLQGSKGTTKNVSVTPEERKKFALTDDEILILAKWACIIEDHYSEKAGHFKPMDMEWAKDGESGELFIVQARPETVQSQRDKTVMEDYVLKGTGKVLTEGKSVGSKIGVGEVNVIKDVHDIKKFKKGQVLVTEMTDPDWEPIMKIASAIVTNKGGRTCHAAIISRELGIPCVVGCITATEDLKKAKAVTVSCAEGETGKVYEGKIKFEIEKHDLKEVPKTKTQIMVNLGNPDQAFELSFLPVSGVGLAREEFVLNEYVKIHPMALINYDSIEDKKLKEQIDELTYGYDDKEEFFVQKLSQGLGMIAAAFHPHDVIIRCADFKSDEYANMIGGPLYEPEEANPMIGWRGASRYHDKNYQAAFELECKALARIRNEFGLKNVKVMIPVCRTIDEGKQVLSIMKKNGLKQGEEGLQIFVMCELPSNVILADQFAEIFDGFSIGSNDLTQMTLGLDRNSELVAPLFDERNEAVKRMVAMAIKTANECGKKIGICGDAPSTYPEFAEFLVECGIKSISLSPDAVIKTTLVVAKKEQELGIDPN